MNKRPWVSLSFLLILGIIWGSCYSMAHFITKNGIHPLGYAFWQSFGPTCFLFLIIIILKLPIYFTLYHIRYYFICGTIGVAIPNLNIFFAASHLPAGLLAVIVNIAPVVTYLLAFSLNHERFSIVKFFGVIVAMIGIACIVIPKSNLPKNLENFSWIISALLTPVCFAVCALFAEKYQPKDSHAISLSAGMLLVSSILITLIIINTENFYFIHIPFEIQDWVLIVGIIFSGLGYVILFKLIKVAGAVYYGLVNGVVCITGLFWGWVFFEENLDISIFFAAFLIIIGIFLVTFKKNKYLK